MLLFLTTNMAAMTSRANQQLNLPREGFPATFPIGHCCVCSPLLFATEILRDSPTYSKQRMNKTLIGGRFAWKHKMHDDFMLNGVFGICLWLVARQMRIPNRQERFMTIAKSHSACDPRVNRARCTPKNYQLASFARISSFRSYDCYMLHIPNSKNSCAVQKSIRSC